MYHKQNNKQKMKSILKSISILIFVAIFGLMSMSCERIDAGNRGIQVNRYGSEKGVQEVTYVTGNVLYNPLTSYIVEFPVYVKHIEMNSKNEQMPQFDCNTKEGLVFKVECMVNYRINSDSVARVFTKYRVPLDEMETQYIKNSILEAYRVSVNEFTADSLISNRAKFDNLVGRKLQKSLGNSFVIEMITSKLTPPSSLIASIENKTKIIQETEASKNRLQKTKNDSAVNVTQALAAKRVKEIESEADALSYRLKQQSLTSQLLKQQWIDKWDGKLPKVITNGNSNLLMDIDK